GIRDLIVTGVQTCALPILGAGRSPMSDGDAGGGRPLHNRHGAGRLRRTQEFRGLLWVPHGWTGTIRERLAQDGLVSLPTCRDRGGHDGLADSVHLCSRWWHRKTFAG